MLCTVLGFMENDMADATTSASISIRSKNPARWRQVQRLLPGILLCAVLAAISYGLAYWPPLHDRLPLSPLIVGILLGVLLRLCVPLPAIVEPGIKWVLFWVLRTGIVLLGFRLVLQDMLSVGLSGLALVFIGVTSTIVLSITLGRMLRLPDTLSTLLGCGTGICGASAVIAVDGVIKGREQDVACAIAAVTFFGTIAMFVDPIIARYIGLSEPVFSAWAGSSIHEVAQAVASGFAFGDHAGVDASLYKLSRVALLAPVCAVIAVWWQRRAQSETAGGERQRVAFPKFVVLFVLMVLFNSFVALPERLHHGLTSLDTALLAAAMVAMGLQTRLVAVMRLGWRPIFLATVIAVWLSALALAGGWLIAG